ncbi:MAG: tetratricopeptide repeat protein [Chloroflexota bacterium]|nr:tetratricopeptide repeat protein [Chloroflexota bacterium]
MTLSAEESRPLIGRREQLDRFHTHLRQAREGRDFSLLLVGEEGSGKTRLLQEFLAEAESEGWEVLAGRCDEDTASDPYGPFLSTLGLCFDQNGQIINDKSVSSIVDQIPLDDVISAVTDIPGIGAFIALGLIGKKLYDQRRRPVEGAELVNRNFEFIRRVMDQIYRRRQRPILLAFDDMQLASLTTCALVDHLLKRTPDTPLAFIGAWQPAPGQSLDAIPRHLRSLGTIWAVPPLSLEEARLLVEDLFPSAGLSAETVGRIHEFSHGLSGLIVESVNLLTTGEENVLDTGAAAQAMPAVLASLASRYLDRLSEPSLSVLTCAAVAGRRFPLAVLTAPTMQNYLGLSERQIVASLFDLARDGRVLGFAEPADAEEMIFTSHYLHAYLHDSTPSRLSRRDHIKMAQAWQQAIPEVHVGQLAYLYLEGGGYQQALDCALRAAEGLMRDAAYPEAVDHYRMALRALDELPPDEETMSTKIDLLLATSFAAEQAGDWDEAIARLQEALPLDMNDEHRAEIHGHLGWLHFKRGQIRAALDDLNTSAETYSRLGDQAGRAWIDYYLGTVYTQQKEWARAIAHFEAHIQVAEVAHITENLDLVYLELGNIYRLQRRWEQAETYLQKGIAIAQNQDDHAALAQGYHYLGVCYGRQGKGEAIEHLNRALSIARERTKQPHQEAMIQNTLAETYVRFNRWDEAEAAFRASERIKLQLGDQAGLAMTYGGLGRLYHRQGRYAEAAEYYQKDLAILQAESGANVAWIQQLTNSLGEVYRLAGERDRADACFRHTLALANEIPDDTERERSQGYSHLGLARLALDRDDLRGGREHCEKAQILLASSWMASETDRVRARLERLEGNLDAARTYLDRALEGFERSGEDVDRLFGYREAARLHKALGDEKQARVWQEKALAVAKLLNNAPMCVQIEKELAGKTSEVLEVC